MKLNIPSDQSGKSGVYIIKNTIDSRVYIGATNKFKMRYNAHKNSFKHGTHTKLFQSFVDEHGIDSLTFEILEQCSTDVLIEREQHFIDLFNSKTTLLNTLPRAGSSTRDKIIHNEEIFHGIKIKRSNVIRIRVSAYKYKEFIKEVKKTGVSIPKLISISSTPCQHCVDSMSTGFNDLGERVYVKRGILCSGFTKKNNGTNILKQNKK